MLGLGFIAALQGCVAGLQGARAWRGERSNVRLQVCLPTRVVEFDEIVLDRLRNHPLWAYPEAELALAPRTVRRVKPSADARTAARLLLRYEEVFNDSPGLSAGVLSLRDSTVHGQPVFDKGSPDRGSTASAMGITLPSPDNGVTYWFVYPHDIPADGFSAWMEPASMIPVGHKSDPALALMARRQLPSYPVSRDAPKMRYARVPRPSPQRDAATDSLPALYTAREKFKLPDSSLTYAYEFVEQAGQPIPACR